MDRGDSIEEAIRALYHAHGQALLAYVASRVGDRRETEEIVQEVIVRAWRYSASFDAARGSERNWLLGIARNLTIDHHKRAARRLESVEPGFGEDTARIDDRIEQVADRQVLDGALAGLSPEHRETIITVYFDGKTPNQIAAETGTPAGTIKSRLFYGLRALRAALEEQHVLNPHRRSRERL